MSPEEQYWAFIASGEFKLQRCEACGNWQFPPVPRCKECLSDRLEWRALSGDGRIWSWIRMHKPYFKRYADRLPYVVPMIELAEGPRLIAALTGPEDGLRCDAAVKAVLEPGADGELLLAFRLVGEDAA